MLVIKPEKIAEHRWVSKTLPSGFFSQPDAENISAVLYNNSATISKLARMGMVARKLRRVWARISDYLDHKRVLCCP